jgi:hypothetical protein
LSKIDQAKIAKYRDAALRQSQSFCDKDSYYYGNGPEIGPLLDRIQSTGRNNVSGQVVAPAECEGMFFAPRTKRLNDVDIACVGIPLDKSESFDLSGPRQGPRALRYASAGQGEIHEPSGLNIFNTCSIIDWGDIEFDESERNRSRDIEQIAKNLQEFCPTGHIDVLGRR